MLQVCAVGAAMTAADVASTRPSHNTKLMVEALAKLVKSGPPSKPQGTGFNPEAHVSRAAAGQTGEGCGAPFTERFFGRTDYRATNGFGKLFDGKTAPSSTYPYVGEANEGATWRKTAREYFISRTKVLSLILGFVEKHELMEATVGAMSTECGEQGLFDRRLGAPQRSSLGAPQQLPRGQRQGDF